VFCSNCGTRNNDAAYCANCGNELRGIQTPSVDVPPLPPQAQTSYGPQASGPYVPTYLAPAILTTLFCCPPFGIVSIVYAAQVNGKLAAEDRPCALQSS
jgi:interferon-induced transmembrane protein